MPLLRFNRYAKMWALSALIVGVVIAGALHQPIELVKNMLIWRTSEHSFDKDLVLVEMDVRSTEYVGSVPWPRAQHAKLYQAITAGQPKRIGVDVLFESQINAADDKALLETLRNSKTPFYLAAYGRYDGEAYSVPTSPLRLDRVSQMASINTSMLFGFPIYQIADIRHNGRRLPMMSEALSGIKAPIDPMPIDWGYNFDSLTRVSAADILSGRQDPAIFKDKIVLVGAVDPQWNDMLQAPFHASELIPGAWSHMASIQTLREHQYITYRDIPALALTMLLLLLALWRNKRSWLWTYVSIFISNCSLALISYHWMRFDAQIGPALIGAFCFCLLAARKDAADMGTNINEATGLGTFAALNGQRWKDRVVILAYFPQLEENRLSYNETERLAFIDSIIKRLELAAEGQALYHDLRGQFIFGLRLSEGHDIEDHVEALRTLFVASLIGGDASIVMRPILVADFETSLSMEQRIRQMQDTAHSKDAAKNSWVTSSGNSEKGRHRLIAAALNNPEERATIEAYFQPQISLATGKMEALEALARWKHPTLGTLSPAEFIHVGEHEGLMAEVTLCVAKSALRQLPELRVIEPNVKMAINMPGGLLADSPFLQQFREIMQMYAAQPSDVIIEITEGSEYEYSGRLASNLDWLRNEGFFVALDDFGQGFSNVTKLAAMPIDEIKLDMAIIRNADKDPEKQAIIGSVCIMARRLSKIIVAEGVDSEALVDLLSELGVHRIQGELSGMPMPAHVLIDNFNAMQKKSAQG